ncbi:MAG: LamG domain-containing protein [Bacteroidota bacterium]
MNFKEIVSVFVICCSVCSTQAQLITDGLVAYYPFTGNTQDESGNGWNGVNTFGIVPITDRLGTANSAYDFTTSDAYVDLGNILNGVFAGQGKQFSIAAWIKPHQAMNDGHLLAKVADTNCEVNQRMFFLKVFGEQSQLAFTYYSATSSGNARRVMSTTSITDTDKWYHVVATYDGTLNSNDGQDRVKLYINCIEETTFLETSTGPLGNIQTSSAHLGIGTYLDANGNSCFPPHNFKGLIDDLYLFNRVLSPQEVALLGQELAEVNLGPDLVLCEGEQATLVPNLEQAIEGLPVQWSDGSMGSELTVTEP